MTQPAIPDWVNDPSVTPDVHTSPATRQWEQLTQEEVQALRKQLIDSIVSVVVEVISGIVPFARPAIEILGDIFGDLFGFLGNPSGIGTGDVQPGLQDAPIVESVVERWQLGIDTLFGAAAGVDGPIGTTLEQLREALRSFDPTAIGGAAGPANMRDSIFGILDSFISGFTGVPGATGGSLAVATNVATQVSSNATLGAYAWELANVVNNTPVARGFLPTGRSNYDITSANTFLACTQSAALSVSFGLLQSMAIGVISWNGYGTSGMTAFYVNVRKVNLATGERTLVHHSANILGSINSGSVPADAEFMFYEIPTPLAGAYADFYYAELVPVGGTHYVRGMSFSDGIPDHPLSNVPNYGTTVDYSANPNSPTTTLPKATGGPNVFWMEFATALGGTADHREPQVRSLDDDGDTIPIPDWCNRVDAIGLGRGGDGVGGATLGFSGRPGDPGVYAAVTWERGTHFFGGEVVTFNAVARTAKLSIPGHEVIAAGGANGEGLDLGLSPVGRGPGIYEYNGQTYVGGADQRVAGADGTDPGGAGNGGVGLLFQGGGDGGKATGWVCFRQVEVPGETPTGDNTPPTAPTSVTFSSITQNSATVTITGGTD